MKPTVRGIAGIAAKLAGMVERAADDGARVTLEARDGRRFSAPMVVAADGVYSVVARRLGMNPGWPRDQVALDLMEEFRPLVDDLVLTLVNRRQLAPEDFAVIARGAGQQRERGAEATRSSHGAAVREMRQPEPHPRQGLLVLREVPPQVRLLRVVARGLQPPGRRRR